MSRKLVAIRRLISALSRAALIMVLAIALLLLIALAINAIASLLTGAQWVLVGMGMIFGFITWLFYTGD